MNGGGCCDGFARADEFGIYIFPSAHCVAAPLRYFALKILRRLFVINPSTLDHHPSGQYFRPPGGYGPFTTPGCGRPAGTARGLIKPPSQRRREDGEALSECALRNQQSRYQS